ncbi:MAG TPA: Crp/Fnr family transcriptional regulator [Thermoanaerobaculia bacterium]|nr:Crp/Fnr family transcriptional regulator [Thermoanaerobaculia bacterium]
MTTSAAAGPHGNALLDRFPEDVRQRLDIADERHESHDVMFEPDELPRWAHFPHFGTVISLTRSTESGTTVEVGIVGWEGVAAVQTLLRAAPTGAEAVVQIAGSVSRVRLDAIRAAMDESPPVRELVLAFAGGFMAQVSQHATCNRVHTIEQRLAKWLLAVRDRIGTDELELTHDFLSHMLGTRRAGATVAVGSLALDGLIEQNRGSVTIVDRDGLAERSCECYRAARDLAPPLPPRQG